MNIKDLKVGNYIHHYNYGCVEVIGVFGSTDVYIKDDFDQDHLIPIDEFKPIPINDNNLTAFGYMIYGANESQSKSDWYWCAYDVHYGAIDYQTNVLKLGSQKIKLEGIHHLQNVIYEISRKEVTQVKPEILTCVGF